MADTKKCVACDATIGASETKCPACGFEIDEETLTNFEKCLSITEKRREAERKKNQPPAPPEPPKKRGFFDSLKGKK